MKSDILGFERFERCYSAARKLLECTNELFRLCDEMLEYPDNIDVHLIILHNAACDFMKAIQREKENKED